MFKEVKSEAKAPEDDTAADDVDKKASQIRVFPIGPEGLYGNLAW